MNRLPLTILAALAGLAATSCKLATRDSSQAGDLGRRFTETVPGTWNSEVRIDGGFSQAEKTFRPDGTANGSLSVKSRQGRTSFVMPAGTFRSKWRVEGDTYISYDIKATDRDLYPPGTELRDRIVSVKPNRIVCYSEDRKSAFTMERIR